MRPRTISSVFSIFSVLTAALALALLTAVHPFGTNAQNRISIPVPPTGNAQFQAMLQPGQAYGVLISAPDPGVFPEKGRIFVHARGLERDETRKAIHAGDPDWYFTVVPDQPTRLFLLLEADRKYQLACDAAQKATLLEPGNAALWETAAALQERSGQFGAAIESYRKLATIDRRYLSNYLTQIASLEMRLGNTDAALKTGEQLIASAPGNSEHYRFFADLCFQVGEEERGLDVLRRNMRSNPGDSDALL